VLTRNSSCVTFLGIDFAYDILFAMRFTFGLSISKVGQY
jgi:hypothetical protein